MDDIIQQQASSQPRMTLVNVIGDDVVLDTTSNMATSPNDANASPRQPKLGNDPSLLTWPVDVDVDDDDDGDDNDGSGSSMPIG
jgi:hypothetical protein